jgi:mannose-6-phosphate isomerase-like protein (cupin superfamily)
MAKATLSSKGQAAAAAGRMLPPATRELQEAQPMKVINLAEKLSRFQDSWNPRIIARLNGQLVKLAKLSGEFVWHQHEKEDELFFVLKGTLRLHFRDGERILSPGEMIVIPRGVEHLPIADEECHVLLFEPESTLNTGEVENERTVRTLEEI